MPDWSSLPTELKLTVAEHKFASHKGHYDGDSYPDRLQGKDMETFGKPPKPDLDPTALLLTNKETYKLAHQALLKKKTAVFTEALDFESFMHHHHEAQGTSKLVHRVAGNECSALVQGIFMSATFARSNIRRAELLVGEGYCWDVVEGL